MQLHKTDINANNTVNTDCILFEALDEILENLNCEIESCIVDERKKGANCDQAVVSIAKNCASSSDNCCVEKHISSDTGALPCTNWTKDYPTKKPTVFDRHEH